MNQQVFKFETISETEFNAIPVAKNVVSKPSPYDSLIEAVITGEIVAMPIEDISELKGIRIGAARRASKAFGVKLQFRFNADKKILAIRLAGDEKPESDEKRGRGRPKSK